MRVPTYDNFQTSQTAQPLVPVQGPSGPGAGEIAGRQEQALGDALQNAGSAAGKIGLAMQDQVNQTRVNDAVNQARIAVQDLTYNPQTGYKALKGNDALSRPSGQFLTDEYGDKLKQHLSDIGGSLSNDEQRRMFGISSNDIAAQFHGQVEQHALEQFGVYHDAVSDSTAALAADGAKTHWDDPDYIYGAKDPQTGERKGGAIDAVKAAIYDKAQRHGLEGAPADQAILQATSGVHRSVVQAALDNNNPAYALSYLEAARKRGEMTGDDILALQGHVNQSVWMNVSAAAVSTTAADAAKIFAPNNFDRMLAITTQTESGGRDTNPDGTAVTSAKGARFALQVMPDTAHNPGFGIVPAKDESAAEYNRVGKEYLQALVQKYGDPAKAWAAYNAGPGAVDKALKDTAGQPDGAWLAALPKETQAYVATNVKAFSEGGGRPDRPTEDQFVTQALAKLPPGAPPQLVQMTRQHAVEQFSVIDRSFKEQGQHALSDVQAWLYSNKDKGVTIADVPPQLMDPLMRYAPGDARNLEAFSKAIQRGDTVTNGGRYNDIVSHWADYARLPPERWDMLQTELSQSTFQKLSDRRAKWLNGTSDDSPNGLDHASVNRVVNQNLSSMGYATQAKPGTPHADWLGNSRLFVDQAVFQAQTSAGKRFTPAEVESFVHGLFVKDVDFRSTLFGHTVGHSSQKLMTVQIGDIADDTLAGLRASFAKRGVAHPTDGDLLNAYRQFKLNQPAQ